jgi:hypothetical protein
MQKYFQAPWSIRDLLKSFTVSALLLFIIIGLVKIFGIKEYFESIKDNWGYISAAFATQWIVIIGPIILLSFKKHKIDLKELGLTKISILKTLKLVSTGYLLYLGITLAVSILVIYTNIKIPGYQIQEKILPLFSGNLILAGIIIVLIAPIIEEIFFRGILLRTISDKIGIYYGSIISAAIFATFHTQWQNIIPIFILGLIINSIVIKGKSLYPAIAFHMLNNAIAFIVEVLILNGTLSIESMT